MIISAAIIAKNGDLFCSSILPYELQVDISKHANDFLYALSIRDEDAELPYIETTNHRYIYKQTDDLYWLVVTKHESEMFNDIHILGKFVCTILEYGPQETNSETLLDEQREIFYRHIWRPWDEVNYCPLCNSPTSKAELWRQEFEGRLQFLISIRNRHVEDIHVDYFNRLVAESWATSAKLSPRWNLFENHADTSIDDTDSVCSHGSKQSINELALIEGCGLKCKLEDIQVALTRLMDPYLRKFARRDLLEGSYYSGTNGISSAPEFKELDSNLSTSFVCDLEQTQQM